MGNTSEFIILKYSGYFFNSDQEFRKYAYLFLFFMNQFIFPSESLSGGTGRHNYCLLLGLAGKNPRLLTKTLVFLFKAAKIIKTI
jgi:hypothetical protein